MAFISSGDLINEANLGKETNPKILMPHIETAEIELKRILGEEKYLRIESWQSSQNESETAVYREVKKGALCLAMSYAVISLNTETQGSGIVKSKGWGESKSELLGSDELNNLREYYRTTALSILSPHIPENTDGKSIDMGTFSLGAL